MKILILLFLFLPHTLFAISEKNYFYDIAEVVYPFIKENGHYELLPASKGISISTLSVYGKGNRGDILIIPGQGEFIPKYWELAYDLIQRGFSAVHIMDHRGQGTSPRIIPEQPQKGTVDEYKDYVEDLYTYVKAIRAKRPDQKMSMIAYSLGAGIAAVMLNQHSDEKLIDDLVFVSPMFGIQGPVLGDTKLFMPYLLSLCIGDTRLCNTYAPWKSRFNVYEDFDSNVRTNSLPRWTFHRSIVNLNPEISINGPTSHWVAEATKLAFKASRLTPPKDIPLLILLAEEDEVVIDFPQYVYCNRSRSCRLLKIEKSKHEILQERDKIREKILEDIDDHFFSTKGLVTTNL